MPTPPGNQPRLPQRRGHDRGLLRTTAGRADKLARWLALQHIGQIPRILVAVDRQYREGRTVVCPSYVDLHEAVATAAGCVVELDRVGAIVWAMDVWLTDPAGVQDPTAALWCVDVTKGSAPMIATIPYATDSEGSIDVGTPTFASAVRHHVAGPIAQALDVAFGQAGQPDQVQAVRAHLEEHHYGLGAFDA